MLNEISMAQFTPTLCDALGIDAPAVSAQPHSLIRTLLNARGVSKVQRCLIYNPDATGMWNYQKHAEWFAPVIAHTQLALPVRTMLPSVTPVCFGTMYTGLTPAEHGIETYEKHPLPHRSLFDCVHDAGMRCALVAVQDSSMDVLYSEKPVTRFIEPYDEQATERACELIASDDYDMVVVYNQEFDDVMHKTYPESAPATAALKHHIAAFDRLCTQAEQSCAGYDSLVCWATDHGTHIADNGHGQHGSDREDDLNVLHFFGAWASRAQ